MAKPKVEVEITAESSGLLDGLSKATNHVRGAAREMEGHTEKLAGIGRNLLAPFVALAGVFGGAAFLKGTVEETVQWTKESQKLAGVLGTTTEKASVLNLAIGDIFATQEEYLAAVGKLTKTLGGNEQAFQRLGVQTRDQNGRYRDTSTLMAEVNGALVKIQGGTERNVAAASIYGKSWMEVQKILKLTPEVIQAAQEKAERLNLIVGSDSVEATKAYRDSMNDLEDTVKAVKVGIGNQLLPVLTQLNNDLADTGPTAISALGVAFKGLYQVILVGRELVEKFFVSWEIGWKIAAVAGSNGLAQLKAVATGRFGDAIALEKDLGAKLTPTIQQREAAFAEIEEEYGLKSAQLWGDVAAKKKSAALDGGAFSGSKDSESALNRLKADLERVKYEFEVSAAARGQLLEFTKAQEAAWLEENITRYDLADKEKAQADKLLFEARRAVLKQGYEGEIEAQKASLELYKFDAEKRLEILEGIARKQIDRFGPGSKEAEESLKEILKLQAEAGDQAEKVLAARQERRKAHQLAELEQDRVFIQQRRANGEISALDELLQLQALEDRKFEIERAALERRLQLANLEPEARAQVLNQIQALEDQHALSLTQTKQRVDAELQKTDSLAGSRAAIRAYLEANQNDFQNYATFTTTILQGMENSIAASAKGILTGQMTLSQGFKAVWKGILDTVAQAVAQMIAKWIAGAIVARIFGQQAGQGAAVQAVASQAAAAAGIFQAHAYIPFVGPAIAAGLVLMMNGVLAANAGSAKALGAGVKAFAVGGVIDKPTLALMGEAGREVVAPEKDFKAWAAGLTGLGARLQANVSAGLAQAQGYDAAGAGYAAAAAAQGRQNKAGGGAFAGGSPYVDLRGAVIAGESAESGRVIRNLVRGALDDWDGAKG